MTPIVLASESPRRQELMSWLGLPFDTLISEFPESEVKFSDFDNPKDYVATLAAGKALAGAQLRPDALIIGSDTVIYLDGEVYGKPKNLDHAREILKKLRGKTHSVLTGVSICHVETGERREEVEKTEVAFIDFSDEALEQYISTGESLGKAGAYAIQDGAKAFVRDVRGSLTSVLGLPLITLRDMLEDFGIPVQVDIENVIFQRLGYRS